MAEIKPELKYEEFIKELTSNKGPFSSIAHLYVFAAAFGFSKNKSKPTSKPRKDQVRDITFKNQGLESNIFTIALADKQSLECLKDKDYCYKIFEGYVNGGLELLKKNQENFFNPSDPKALQHLDFKIQLN